MPTTQSLARGSVSRSTPASQDVTGGSQPGASDEGGLRVLPFLPQTRRESGDLAFQQPAQGAYENSPGQSESASAALGKNTQKLSEPRKGGTNFSRG